MSLSTFLLVIAAQAAGISVPTTSGPEVVVTGRRYADALTRCLTTHCSPEQEVDAAMDAAAEDFRVGRYEDAMHLLQRAIDRNKQYTARMPGRMSDLYATHADVAAHFGNRTAYMNSTWSSVDVLKKYAGKTSFPTLAARPCIGDMLALDGQATAAEQVYQRGKLRCSEWTAAAGSAHQLPPGVAGV